MKLAFCTCVKLGKSCIEKVYEIGGKFDLLITLEDHLSTKKSGRIFLDDIAQKNDTPLLKINHINDEASINSLIDYEIDWYDSMSTSIYDILVIYLARRKFLF